MIGFGKQFKLAFLPLLALALAQLTDVRAERLPIKGYTTGDGLAHNNIHRIVRDSRGFLWFCTFGGLSRFDGYSFTSYSVDQGLPSPVVNDLLETREGEYWVATGAGLSRFNPTGIANGRGADGATFTTYGPGPDAASKNVLSLRQSSDGRLWCGTAAGLYELEMRDGQGSFRRVELGMRHNYERDSHVTSIIEDSIGSLWIGSPSGIYRLLPDGRAENYNRRNGLPTDDIHCMLEDREGHIWAGTRSSGLLRLVPDPDPSRPAVARAYTDKDGLPSRWINQIYQSSDGTLWAASSNGLIRFLPTADGKDFRFRSYAVSQGLSYHEVQSLAEDRNGNLWVGMLVGGVAKLSRNGITAFTEADGFKWASAIYRDRSGTLLVLGSPNRLEVLINRLEGEHFNEMRLRLPKGVSYSWGWNQVLLEDHAGEWWVATAQGVCRYPRVSDLRQLTRILPKAVYTTREGLPGREALRLFEDSRGDVWISTIDAHGLSRFDRKGETLHNYSGKDGLPDLSTAYPISFCEDRTGAVWIGFSIGGGLVRYRNGLFTRFTSADGLAEGGIFNLFVDSQGRLWIPTTRGGVCRIDNPGAERPHIITYTTADGLSSNQTKCVTEDDRGRIYIGTDHGIERLDVATGRIKRYTQADGLPLGDTRAALRSGDGSLWFSFATGLVRLVPERETPSLPPPIHITGVRAGGEPRSVSALGETEVAPVELGPDRNYLQIDFVALGFGPGENLRYQYRLEGAGDDWRELAEQRTVNFASLAPGRYRFLVRAVNADGVMSERPAGFSFVILSPVWRRWWFVTLAALLAGAIISALYRYRMARLLELERVRTRIAADLHDDIGSNLTKIAILSEVAQQRIGYFDLPGESPLSSVARISRESLASMSDIVWAINPKKDSLRDLSRRMRGFASDVFTSREIAFSFNASAHDFDLKLGPDIRRDVFLIFKEAVNNALRHSGCAKVAIELKLEGPSLALIVADDGSGFDTSQSGEGNGLASMRSRSLALGGELRVHSSGGRGTTLTLVVPIRRRKLLRPT